MKVDSREAWEEVINLLGRQPDSQALSSVLSLLLTAEESEAVGSRLAIMQALIAGQESQRDIAARLGVSIAKVTRGSNYLKTLDNTEKRLIEG